MFKSKLISYSAFIEASSLHFQADQALLEELCTFIVVLGGQFGIKKTVPKLHTDSFLALSLEFLIIF